MIARLRKLHADQAGSISLVSVFALLLLVFLLGMVMNSARQVDRKVKLRNASDAAALSGGMVITRNMNTLAFTNHLLCDVFALTAFMREARDQMSRPPTSEILDNWARIGPFLSRSEYPPFANLGNAIQQKVPLERQMVDTFCPWVAAASQRMLPVFEEILANEQIPEFQRALTQLTPELSQNAAEEAARRHGSSWPISTTLHGVMWRTAADPVGGNNEQQRRSLPVVDPELDSVPDQQKYVRRAKRQREQLSHRYLRDWNAEQMYEFDRYGKMSQFSNLWRIFTCGQLKRLLEEEYPDRNLLFQIRVQVDEMQNVNAHLEQDFMFVGVVYARKLNSYIPGMFKNPLAADSQAFSQVSMFVPRRRLVDVPKPLGHPWTPPHLPRFGVCPPSPRRQSSSYFPEHWDLLNQNWSVQLVPATTAGIPTILSTQPYVRNIGQFQLPNLQGMQPGDLDWISNH